MTQIIPLVKIDGLDLYPCFIGPSCTAARRVLVVIALPLQRRLRIAGSLVAGAKKKREKLRTDQTGTFSEETLSFLELLFRQKFS